MSEFNKDRPGKQKSLLEAIQKGNKKLERKLERKMQQGKVIRII